MNNWTAPLRPNAYAENTLINAILDGTFPPGTSLPGERALASQLGITRPTLREAIQRLSRDGWLTVRQGKPTAVNDYWQEGGLNVLNSLVQHSEHLPDGFVHQLLTVRQNLAPAYTQAAVKNNPKAIAQYLYDYKIIADTPQAYASFDWQLHRKLSIISGNPIYTLILNGFSEIYENLATLYFAPQEARALSRHFYQKLAVAAEEKDSPAAKTICAEAMEDSIHMWQKVNRG